MPNPSARRSLRSVLSWGAHTDGRIILIAVVIGYLGVVAAGRLVWRVDLWPFLGVPSGPSIFFDARNLTAAWESQRLGYDPLYQSPRDPWGRPLMYLRPWLLLAPLGLDQSHTVVLAVALIAAMLVSFCLLVGRVPIGTGVMLAIAVCSPATMLAIERANMDIALFSIVAGASLLWRAFPRPARVLSPILMLLAATAKIYPVFALPGFVATRSRVAARTALLCVAVFAVYFVYSFRDVAQVMKIAPQGEEFSYGARILPAHLYHVVGAERWAGPAAVKQLLAVVPLGLFAAAIALRIHRHLAPTDDEPIRDHASFVALYAGALIYLGTFATANNFDYRLVCLLLTLPQLVEWARLPEHRLLSLASATLVAVIALLWVGSLSRRLHLWDELASWAVAGLLAAVIAATWPSRQSLRRLILGGFASRAQTT